MNKRKRLLAALASAAIIGGAAALVAAPAQANTGNQYCYYLGGYACVNAWGGGPWVNTYTGGPGTSNNDFSVINNYATGDQMLQFTGGGSWNGHCVGDAYNDSGDARTSLDSCGNGGEGAGWGTNFISGVDGCQAGWAYFYNTHWGGWLGPPDNWVNGSHFYLNKTVKYCFKVYSPA